MSYIHSPSMHTGGTVTFRNPFETTYNPHNQHQTFQSALPPFAAYANLNRPPTPPPDMHGGHFTSDYAHTHQERGYESGQLEQHKYKHAQAVSQEAHNGRPLSPASLNRSNVTFEPTHDRQSSQANAIAPSFQIPKGVNDSGGSLSELAAEITCLFWFESSDLLQQIEESVLPVIPIRPLAKDAIPTTGFRKWVTTILSTTLVGANVVLLALLFIHRLKKLNPSVKGKPGSEYRLLTVALMLGNKFLDDNTYTNKTWAEVSGIMVNEVHIMEVEFLSNMKYCLYTSSEDWTKWQSLLGSYADFFSRAQNPLPQRTLVPPPILPPSSTLRMPIALPSPPASTQASPPYAADMTPMANGPTPAPSPLALSAVGATRDPRKRSFDDYQSEPSAKRVALAKPYSAVDGRSALPNLPASISQAGFSNTGTLQQLPPLAVPARAMGLVYPSSTSTLATPLSATSRVMPIPQLLPHFQQSRQHSPYPSSGNSPTDMPTPANLLNASSDMSPSIYLRQRSSPYRPVHNVSTLLYPPPSAARQPQSVEHTQMHYQSIGKQPQLQTGRLPHIGHAWLDANLQANALAPMRQWPPSSAYQPRHPLSQ